MIVPDLIALEVTRRGQFYNPANLHYGGQGSVNCDLCKATFLPSCLGATVNGNKYDLCLACVNRIQKQFPQPVPLPGSVPSVPLPGSVPSVPLPGSVPSVPAMPRPMLPQTHPRAPPGSATPPGMAERMPRIVKGNMPVATYMVSDRFVHRNSQFRPPLKCDSDSESDGANCTLMFSSRFSSS